MLFKIQIVVEPWLDEMSEQIGILEWILIHRVYEVKRHDFVPSIQLVNYAELVSILFMCIMDLPYFLCF